MSGDHPDDAGDRGRCGTRGDGCSSGPDPDWPCRACVDETSRRLLSMMSGGGEEANNCASCQGYYGNANGQPVCATCHAFLYANDVDVEANAQVTQVHNTIL